MSKQQIQVTQSAETKTKTRTFGGKVGAAITRIQSIRSAEQTELAQSPSAIKEKYAKRLDSFLAELEPEVKRAALAAATAMDPKSVAAE